MKFSILISSFIRQLTEVSGIAGTSPNKEDITQNILMTVADGKLSFKATDYNLELEAVMPCTEIESEGAVAINPQKLRDTLKTIPNEFATFILDEANQVMTVRTSGNSEFEIRTRVADNFPNFALDVPAQTLTLKQGLLKNIIDKSLFCIANEEFREYLKGLRLEGGGSKLSAYASDGHRMAVVDMVLPDAVPEKFGAILTRKAAAQLSKLLEPNSKTDIVLKFTAKTFTSEFNGYRLSAKLVVTPYPNVRGVIPSPLETSITVPVAELKSKLATASVLASKRVNGITLTFGNGNLLLSSENSEHEIAKTTMPAPYTGQELVISLNATYLMNALSAVDTERVTFNFANPLTSALLIPCYETADNKEPKPEGETDNAAAAATAPATEESAAEPEFKCMYLISKVIV